MGVRKERKIPQRTCLGCQMVKGKRELIRIVRTPQGTIEIDLKGRMAGRGAYICRNSTCLEEAFKKKSLNRALRGEVSPKIFQALRDLISRGKPPEDS